MTTLFVVVKGQACDAERIAQEKKIELTVTGESTNYTETYCECPITEKRKVIDWYCEDAGYGGEFATGSCLWYAERD